MMGTGQIAKCAVMADLFMLMVMYIPASLKTIKLMVKVYMSKHQVSGMKVSGLMTSLMDRESRFWQTGPYLKVSSKMALKMVRVFINGMMAAYTKESGKMTNLRAMANTFGVMVENM